MNDTASDGRIIGMSVVMAKGRTLFIADTNVTEMPVAEELVEIAIEAARAVKTLGYEPKVAFMSYSTFGNPMGERSERVRQAVAMLDDDPLLFEPGTQHRYSIWGWVLVSAVVQGASGEPFSRFMVDQVFEPLAMTRSSVAETAALDDAHPFYAPRAMLRPRLGVEEAKRPDYSCLAGGGAFLSTPSDLVRLGSAMLKPGFLTAETIAAVSG